VPDLYFPLRVDFQDMSAADPITLRLIVRPAENGAGLELRNDRGETLAAALRLPLDWVGVRDESRRARQVLARSCHHAGGNERDAAELRELASSLARRLLTSEIQAALSAHAGAPVCLQLSGAAREIPWEILPVGDLPLGLQLAPGRVCDDERNVPLPAEPGTSRDALRVGVAVNPEFNLPGTVYEADAVGRLFRAHDLDRAVIARRHRVTRDDLAGLIAECDWLHFAGHAEITTAGVAWKLADGDWTAADWEQAAAQCRTRFVFAHACSSAGTLIESAGAGGSDASGAGSIQAAGVRHVLGTAVPIPDRDAAEFCAAVYREVLSGETIGEAVRRARCCLVDECRAAGLLWSLYILHGPPDQSLLTDATRRDN
jgi:hypothetical protein